MEGEEVVIPFVLGGGVRVAKVHGDHIRMREGGDVLHVPLSALPALISALQAALPDGGWLPIDENTPRDGTVIQLLGVGFVAPGLWNGAGWFFWDGECALVDDEVEDYGVLNSWIDGHEPTHWKPLDTPPPTVSKGDGL